MFEWVVIKSNTPFIFSHKESQLSEIFFSFLGMLIIGIGVVLKVFMLIVLTVSKWLITSKELHTMFHLQFYLKILVLIEILIVLMYHSCFDKVIFYINITKCFIISYIMSWFKFKTWNIWYIQMFHHQLYQVLDILNNSFNGKISYLYIIIPLWLNTSTIQSVEFYGTSAGLNSVLI